MEIIKLEERHVVEAAHLFIEGYKKLREAIPLLPKQHESMGEVVNLITEFIKENEAVVAVQEGRVIGYMLGYEFEGFFNSLKSFYVPVWGHSTIEIGKKEIYGELFTNRSKAGVSREHLTYCITIFSNDSVARDIFSWLGFGMRVVDAIREITAVEVIQENHYQIRRANLSDVQEVSQIAIEHQNYMTQAPIFMPLFEEEDEAYYQEFISHPDKNVWIALKDDEIIGYMQIEKSTEGTTHIVADPNSIAITGAFTRPEYRSYGVAKVLLNTIMLWAKENNKTFCSVDFETFNVHGTRFWLKHFEPVCYSMVRVIDDRIINSDN